MFFYFRLAEELLAKETLSLPEIVDILGPRPYPLKETLKEYLQELRDRQDIENELKAAEEKAQAEKSKAASEAIKFDPDAEEAAEEKS